MDKPKISRWKQFSIFLNKRFRLVILSDNTFSEKFSLRMKPAGILIGILAITIVMTSLIISIIAFTPLREYIPGYGNIAERKQILKLSIQADSLEETLAAKELFLNSLINVLNEKVETKGPKPKRDSSGKTTLLNAKPSAADIEFREDYEKNKNNSLSGIAKIKLGGLSELVFFTPVNGMVSNSFSIKDQHYGLDVVTKADETIKSTLDGTVIFTGFTAQEGNIIQVQHSNNLISVYKHCSVLLRKTGDRIKSGEAIAVVGNTGEKSNGPHLHVELWFNGSPVNPQEFVAF